MRPRRAPHPLTWIAGALGLSAAAYAAYVAKTWIDYGYPNPASDDAADPLLNQFMPVYEIAERHHIRIAATPDITMKAAAEASFQESPAIQTIIRAREFVLGASHNALPSRHGLMSEVQALGWRILAKVPGREYVVGAVTQPWLPDVVFRGLSPDDFIRFNDPDFVKIAWTLRADPDGEGHSIFRTETRVMTTDPHAREKFRWYWAKFSPGILIIRQVLLPQVKRDAERMTNEMCD